MLKDKKYDLSKNEGKLSYVIDKRGLITKEIAKKLGVTSALIARIKNHIDSETTKLRNMHIYAICFAYDIPIEIFETKSINTREKIDLLLNQEKKKTLSIFHEDQEVLNKIVGTWYMYSYPSNRKLANIWETKTVFYEDNTVEDEHKNKGVLHIGKNQSIILKESNGSKNITSITFDNSRIFYNVFLFSRVSKSNSINKELFNFGICSRKKLKEEDVKTILGECSNVQLQMNYDILERISLAIEMDD